MSESPTFIELPVPGPDDPPVIYRYCPTSKCSHVLLWRGNSLELSTAELAAIPIVKALVEAADFAQRTMNDYGNAINWPSDMPMEYATAINKLRDAVLSWKEAADGTGM